MVWIHTTIISLDAGGVDSICTSGGSRLMLALRMPLSCRYFAVASTQLPPAAAASMQTLITSAIRGTWCRTAGGGSGVTAPDRCQSSVTRRLNCHTTQHRATRTRGDARRSRRRAPTCCECWVQQRPSLQSASCACGQSTLHTLAWLSCRADVGSRMVWAMTSDGCSGAPCGTSNLPFLTTRTRSS